jgi:hypothetical protein
VPIPFWISALGVVMLKKLHEVITSSFLLFLAGKALRNRLLNQSGIPSLIPMIPLKDLITALFPPLKTLTIHFGPHFYCLSLQRSAKRAFHFYFVTSVNRGCEPGEKQL